MVWREMRNAQQKDYEKFSGFCKKYNEMAMVTVVWKESWGCKTDQKTSYKIYGGNCSLLNSETSVGFDHCAQNCSLITKKY